MSTIITEEKAEEIISMCNKIESFTALVKAEMNALRGGVGTAPNKQNKRKADKIAEIRNRFHKRK